MCINLKYFIIQCCWIVSWTLLLFDLIVEVIKKKKKKIFFYVTWVGCYSCVRFVFIPLSLSLFHIVFLYLCVSSSSLFCHCHLIFRCFVVFFWNALYVFGPKTNPMSSSEQDFFIIILSFLKKKKWLFTMFQWILSFKIFLFR